MEKRTLVKSGASSFNIALPIDWVRKNKLEKGSEVSIDENETGDLILTLSRDPFAFQQSHHTIKVTPENSKLLYWELLQAYLHNYTIINLEGENVSSISSPVIQHLNSFIGLDVIEQTKNLIVLKNFSAKDTDTSPYNLVKKLDFGVRAMIDTIQFFFSKGFSHDDVLELQSQHEYNERVYLYAFKIIDNIIDAPSLMRVFKTDYRQLMKEHELINSLRQISFRLAKMGKLLLFIEHGGKGARAIKEMFGVLHAKYRTVVSLPKNPISREMIEILNCSKENVARWESNIKDLKIQPLIELFFYGISINSILDQLGLELMN